MSSAYPDYVKALNPDYYWRMVQYFSRGNSSPAKTYTDVSSTASYAEPQEERQHQDNADSNDQAERSRGYYSDLSVPGGEINPYKPGPLFGGESRSLNYFSTSGVGLRLIQSGSSSDTLTHSIPTGVRDFSAAGVGNTWNFWIKAHADTGANATEHWCSSATTAQHQHFMIGDRNISPDPGLKIKTRYTANDNVWSAYVYNMTQWNMMTFVQDPVAGGETITDGLRIYINGKLAMAHDATYANIPEAPYESGLMYIYFMASYKTSAGRKPGLYSEITAWERTLSDADISNLYYHAISPSPMRVRGGLNRQLGRLI